MNIRKIAIIGIGPRGGYALENYTLELIRIKSFSNIHMLLFEETGNFGNGQVYDINQSRTNWINISERFLLLDKREKVNHLSFEIPSFPSYHEWIKKDFDSLANTEIDTYPPRALVGEYLKQRFQTFIRPLVKAKMVNMISERVENVTRGKQNKIILKTNSNTYDDIDEILVTIGHQPTIKSKQIAAWESFTTNKSNINLFQSPYPVSNYLGSKNLTDKSVIGIRGFGLAMIDVVRSIAEQFGKFSMENESTRSCKYQTNHEIKNMFVPFSLDGLPPAPKPLNALIDSWFEPSREQIAEFERKIGNAIIQKEATSPYFLINAFAPIAAKIFSRLNHSYQHGKFSIEEIQIVIENWLQNNLYDHPTIIPLEQSVKKTMEDFVGMAVGEAAISLDFCIGQVWRHCQPSIYNQLSFNECSEKVFAEIIALDEGTKRYSYGPPVESIQQILALIDANILSLGLINNPDFELTDDGWHMIKNDQSFTADIMINSVLDSPKIEAVNSAIVKSMLSQDLIEAVHDNLGVFTDENGFVISNNKGEKMSIALLGRLAKGTIIGVDAILECFGIRPQKWAEEAANNHKQWLRNNS